MQRVYRCLLVLALSWPVPDVPDAHAQAVRSDPEAAVRQLLGLALDNIQNGLCEGGKTCSPATAHERADPPVTLVEAKEILGRAFLSAMGEHCGLDWKRINYLPMMAHWRDALKSPERKLTLIALFHGIAQGQFEAILRKRGPCSDADRLRTEARLAFRA
jgi:hypothetical protein